MLTAGTTGLGAVDPIDEALALRERYGVRLHVDAAYGGFFALLAAGRPRRPAAVRARSRECDSRRRRPAQARAAALRLRRGAVRATRRVGRLYRHDSPYTYFTSDELHLGEITLECSRAGAAAAALWLTLRLLPLEPGEGLGAVLRRRRARGAARGRLCSRTSDELTLHPEPELDIVTLLPAPPSVAGRGGRRVSARAARRDGRRGRGVPVSTLRVAADALARAPAARRGRRPAAVLRSVLMKPEHEAAVPWLHERLRALAAR